MNKLHPQTQSFFRLMPLPGDPVGSSCLLADYFARLWTEVSAAAPRAVLPTLVGLAAAKPEHDHVMAERGGSDYTCSVGIQFDSGLAVPLGNIPYPDDNGEFVIAGNRYLVPMFLRFAFPARNPSLAPETDDASSDSNAVENNSLTNLDSESVVSGNASDIDLDDSDSLPNAVDPRDTDAMTVVLLSDLLGKQLVRVLRLALKNATPEILALSGRDAQPTGQLDTILRTYLGNCLERHIRHFIQKTVGRLVDTHNPLGRFSARTELSFYGPGGIHPESVGHLQLRDVHEKDLYRICPVQTPQGHTVGLRLNLARQARIDVERGKILAPEDPDPGDSLSDAASLIPFIEHDAAARALMGSNMMNQALPLLQPEIPWIETGWEQVLAGRPEVPDCFKKDQVLAMGANLLVGYMVWGLDTFEDGIVVSRSAASALTSIEEETFWFDETREWWEGQYRTVEVTADNPDLLENGKDVFAKLDPRGIVREGEEVGPDDVLVSAILKRTATVNKTQIVDRLVAAIFDREAEELRDASLRLPQHFRGRVVRILDSSDHDCPPMVLSAGVTRRIGITVRRVEPVAVGDKITGRHGNKGVVVRILPDIEMPYMKTQERMCQNQDCPIQEAHRHVQVILNPLGVLGRLNVGQLYETALSKVAERERRPFTVAAFEDHWTPDRLSENLSKAGFAPDAKEQLYVFEKGSEHILRDRSLVGPQYFLRLYHRAWDKLHARGLGQPWDYTVRDDQPPAGKRNRGGQRIGEMETWAIAGHSAWHVLDDLLTVKSDDNALRKLSRNPSFKWDYKRRPRAVVNLILALRGLALDLSLRNEEGENVTQPYLDNPRGVEFAGMALDFASPSKLEKWNLRGEVKSQRLYADFRRAPGKTNKRSEIDLSPHPHGLQSALIFEKHWHMGQITLAQPIVHPLAARALWDVFHYPERFVESASNVWGTELCDFIGKPACKWPELEESKEPGGRLTFHRLKRILEALKETGRQPECYLLNCIPVVPRTFRFEQLGRSHIFEHDLNRLYLQVLLANSRLKVLMAKNAPEAILRDGRERLFHAVTNLFFGGSGLGGRSLKGLLETIEGKRGLLRGRLAGKRVDLSGRAVIAGDPTLPIDEISLPMTLWNTMNLNLPHSKSQRNIVLLNRQPSLHRYSALAFYASPSPIDDVIRLSPFVCRSFNADFDGDTMAVHIPRKPQARKEMEGLLPSLNLFSQASGNLILSTGGDLALGAAYVSYHSSLQNDDEVPLTHEDDLKIGSLDVFEERVIEGIHTTTGRLLLGRAFGRVPIPNRTIGSADGTWQKLIKSVAKVGPEALLQLTKNLSALLSATLKKSALSLAIADFHGSRMNANLESRIEVPAFLMLCRQASVKGDLEQLIGPRGTMRRPGTYKLSEPITSGLIQGHSEAEYLRSAHGARAGLVDKGLNVAHAGIFLRRLIYMLDGVYIIMEDCGASEGMEISVTSRERIAGRYLCNGNESVLFGQEVEHPTKGTLFYRTPYKCRAKTSAGKRGICQKCYGLDPATGRLPQFGLPVGILAAQAIGERASQLTLRTFHKEGGRAEETLDLHSLSAKIFRSNIQTAKGAKKWIDWIMNSFEKHEDPPKQVHLEVILRSVTAEEDFKSGFLSQLSFSNVSANLLAHAGRRSQDDLWRVLSRILSGRLIGTGPME